MSTSTPFDSMLDQYDRGRLTRRQLVAALAGLAAGAAGAGRALAQQDAPVVGAPMFQATEVNHIALRVTDVARSRDFYVKHLGLRVTRDSPSSCFLDCGKNFLALFRSDEARMDHYCYTIRDYDPTRAVEALKREGLEPRRSGNRVYFDDPDGLEVQVSAPNG